MGVIRALFAAGLVRTVVQCSLVWSAAASSLAVVVVRFSVQQHIYCKFPVPEC